MLEKITRPFGSGKLLLALVLLAAPAPFVIKEDDDGCCNCTPAEGIHWKPIVVELSPGARAPLELWLSPEAEARWSIATVPNPEFIKSEELTFSAATARTTTLNIRAQNVVSVPIPQNWMFHGHLDTADTAVQVQAAVVGKDKIYYQWIGIALVMPLLRVSDFVGSTEPSLLIPCPPHKKCPTEVSIDYNSLSSSATGTAVAEVLSPRGGETYQFSAVVPPSKRKYVTVEKVEPVSATSARISLRIYRPPAGDPIYTQSSIEGSSVSVFISAADSGGRRVSHKLNMILGYLVN